jgi:hypothetical protein
MLGTEGQYLFKFSIAGREDFIEEEDFHLFKMIEEAGNVLPQFMLSFTTYDDDILALINEGNDIEVSYGADRDSLTDSILVVQHKNIARSGDSKMIIVVTGFYSALGYITDTKKFISTNKSGVEVISDIVSPYFTPDFNISKSSDQMNWVQHNITDREYVKNLWMHSYLSNSFIGCGITMDGRFILKNVKLDMKNGYKWRFIHGIVNDNDVSYDGDYGIDENSGFTNTWIGYGREKMIFNVESGAETLVSEEVAPLLAITEDLTRRAEIEKRYASAGIINDNVHENYWNAYLGNLSNLAVLGTVKLVLSFSNRFIPIRIWDLCMFKDDSPKRVKEGSNEYYAGLYYPGKVVRILQHKQFVTAVELGRESLNQVKINK